MNCPNCGSILPNDSTFCDDCGTPIAPWQTTQSKLSTQQNYTSQSINDSLFNSEPVYLSIPVQQKNNSILKEILISISIIAVIVFVFFYVLGGRYNGAYELVSMSYGGFEFDTDVMVRETGYPANGCIDVSFRKCNFTFNMNGNSNNFKSNFKIEGDKVTIYPSNASYYDKQLYTQLTGTYDSKEKSITLDLDGVQIKFVKK